MYQMIGVNTIISVAVTPRKVGVHAKKDSLKMQSVLGCSTLDMTLKMVSGLS
jgi:hypothetical protein